MKNPKMLVVCEDTNVSPFVVDFLMTEDLAEEDVLRIDSDAKGNVKEKEWKEVETKLFDLDHHTSPKVIVSVLMLREGFDVNNICVIVPLRASNAPIPAGAAYWAWLALDVERAMLRKPKDRRP